MPSYVSGEVLNKRVNKSIKLCADDRKSGSHAVNLAVNLQARA